jgi:single-stranded-DNA-specific exonuclease
VPNGLRAPPLGRVARFPISANATPVRRAFRDFLLELPAGRPVFIISHNDADGLAAAGIFSRALEASGRPVRVRVLKRGETPWSEAVKSEIMAGEPGGLIVADLGTRSGVIVPDLPTLIVDHHVPTGTPESATLISGYGYDPAPTSSLLAWWCASELVDASSLLWLAALGLIGDMAEGAGFPEMEEARARYGVTALRKATSLVNAPRRAASGDPGPALALLMSADGPKEITAGSGPEAAALRAAKDEVNVALEAGRRIGPKLRGEVALIRFDTPCQVHPLLAQTWRGRLKDKIVIAANAGYRPGWVHFAARTAQDTNLVEFLARNAPPGADENYGSGHAKASGGALGPQGWNTFIRQLGFGPEEQVPE